MKENENWDCGGIDYAFNQGSVQDNNNYMCSYGLLKNGEARNLANALKQLVKYDRDLFEIFSKIKINNNPDYIQQMQILSNFISQLDKGNGGDLKVEELDQSNAPKIVKKNTSKVEEKIDYIIGNYEGNPAFADMQMYSDTGYWFNSIFDLVSEIAKGENNFECELGTFLVFGLMKTKEKEKLMSEQDDKIKKITLDFVNSASDLFAFESKQSDKKEVLAQLQEKVQNYETARENLEKLFNGTLTQIKEVLGIPNENNKDNSNLNLDIKKDKDEQFAIRRTFWGYMGSFLKNILLDLTLVNPIRKIFFLNKIKGQIQSLKTEMENKIEQLTEELDELKQEDLLKLKLKEGIGEPVTKIMEKMFKMLNNVLERISKKNKLWSLILDAVATITPSVLFACSLIFAWSSILNYIFLATLLASIVYKGIKQYRQERRKYLATKASQYLNKPPQNSIYDVFDRIQQNINMLKQNVLSKINCQTKRLENDIRQIEQIGNNIDNEEKPEEEIKEEDSDENKREEIL